MRYEKLRAYVVDWLGSALPANLYYHGLHHTLDVCQAAESLARAESVSPHELVLVQTAAMLHDAGFVRSYFKNEPLGAEIAAELLPNYGYSPDDIAIVQQMILATTLPQQPTCHLDMILCDADLDYLGRDDFYQIAHTLKQEWNEYNIHKTLREWYEQQIRFVANHRYFTATAQSLRNNQKARYIEDMNELLGYQAMVDVPAQRG
jgi:uncharacterized protein